MKFQGQWGVRSGPVDYTLDSDETNEDKVFRLLKRLPFEDVKINNVGVAMEKDILNAHWRLEEYYLERNRRIE
jgi:hypothetical protein